MEASHPGKHDVYHKQPFYNFELHRGLFVEFTKEIWAQNYQDPFKHAAPDKKIAAAKAENYLDAWISAIIRFVEPKNQNHFGLSAITKSQNAPVGNHRRIFSFHRKRS